MPDEAVLEEQSAQTYSYPFEGVEKRLIVRFSELVFAHQQPRVDENGDSYEIQSLRDFPDMEWKKILDFAACSILSKISSEGGPAAILKKKKKLKKRKRGGSQRRGPSGWSVQRDAASGCTAYLLSESSLFVYDTKVILKTCGTTTPLLCVEPLLDLVVPPKLRSLPTDRVTDFLLFTHLNYKFPERQQYPHRNFEEEVAYTTAFFPHGEAFQLPTGLNKDFNVILAASPAFVKVATSCPTTAQALAVQQKVMASAQLDTDPAAMDDAGSELSDCSPSNSNRQQAEFEVQPASLDSEPEPERDLDISELMMLGVDEQCVDYFAGPHPYAGHVGVPPPFPKTAGALLKKVLPAVGSSVDQFWFDPQGYSCNALNRNYFLTAHIAPEAGASYASVEANFPFGHMSYPEFTSKVVECFKPEEVHVVQIKLNTEPLREPPLPAESKAPEGFSFVLKRRVDVAGQWFKISHAHYVLAPTCEKVAEKLGIQAASLNRAANRPSLPPPPKPVPPSRPAHTLKGALELRDIHSHASCPNLQDHLHSGPQSGACDVPPSHDMDRLPLLPLISKELTPQFGFSLAAGSACTSMTLSADVLPVNVSIRLPLDEDDEAVSEDTNPLVDDEEELEDGVKDGLTKLGLAVHDVRALGVTQAEVMAEEQANMGASDATLAVVNVQTVMNRCRRWRRCLPRVSPLWVPLAPGVPGKGASASGPVSRAVHLAMAASVLGCGCASAGEIEMVAAGADKEGCPTLIACGVGCAMIGTAVGMKAQRRLVAFGKGDDLDAIHRDMPEAELLLRVAPSSPGHLALLMAAGAWTTGATPGAWKALFGWARSLGLKIVGVSFDVSQGILSATDKVSSDPSFFSHAIASARLAFDALEAAGFEPSVLDIGGGWGSIGSRDFEGLAKQVSACLDLLFPPSVTVLARPSCDLIARSATMACPPGTKAGVYLKGSKALVAIAEAEANGAGPVWRMIRA